MLWLDEYKKYKTIAVRMIGDGDSNNIDIKIKIFEYKLGRITEDQAIDTIINILSNGEHKKPYKRD